MNPYILLIADNNPRSVEILSETFTQMGWRVLTASNPHETRNVLEHTWVHLAVIDMRLTNELDGDRSGLDIVQTVALHIPKIIWTNFPHHMDARDALAHKLGAQSQAVDYIDKKKEFDDIIKCIETNLHSYVPLNKTMQLLAHHMPYMMDRDVVRMLFNQINHTADITEQEEHIDELDDLLRLVFPNQSLFIYVRTLSSRADIAFIEVQVSAPSQEARSYLFAYGNPPIIQDVYTRYHNYASRLGLTTEGQKRSTHFAILLLTMTGQLESMERLLEYYSSAPLEHIREVFTHICVNTLRRFCQSEIVQRTTSEVAQYYCSRLLVDGAIPTDKHILQRVDAICQEVSSTGGVTLSLHKHKLNLHTIEGVKHSYIWPMNILNAEQYCADRLSFCAMVNGNIHADTILVNPENLEACLYDYSLIGHGPMLYDYAMLETMLKFQLLGRMSLAERFALENHLNDMSSLNITIVKDGLSPELQRALTCIERIRFHAARLRPDVDLRSYQVGLLYTSLRQILTFPISHKVRHVNILAYAHCVLNCAGIHQMVTVSLREPKAAGSMLSIDDELKELVIGEQRIGLTTSELAIMHYLYSHQGKVCSYADICTHALGLRIKEPGDLKSYESTYQPHISRIREKIEEAIGENKYIETVRNRGYRLLLE